MTNNSGHYSGRFAPSPTGPLHQGSLLMALASYLDARHANGRWLLRMDDLDTPRNVPGAADAILRTLEQHGLEWDEQVIYQSARTAEYAAALGALTAEKVLFYCDCARRSLDTQQPYPGHCRERQQREDSASYAVRVKVGDRQTHFDDRVCGPQQIALDQSSPGFSGGDFVVWRRDDIPGYQLATAVDDGDPTITQIVRGNDLLSETPRQLYLMTILAPTLGLAQPTYAHLPVLADASGTKLSKQTGAEPVQGHQASQNIWRAMAQLHLAPPQAAQYAPVTEQLAWAIPRWKLPKASKNGTIPLS